MMCWPHYCSWDVTSFLMILPSHPICLFLLRQELELHTLPQLTLNSLCRLSFSPSIMASFHSSYHCLFIYRIVNTAWNQGRSELQLFFPFCTMLYINLVILFCIILIPSWCCQICRIWLPSQEILSVLSKYHLPRWSLLVYTFVCLSMSSSNFAKRRIRNALSLSFFQCACTWENLYCFFHNFFISTFCFSLISLKVDFLDWSNFLPFIFCLLMFCFLGVSWLHPPIILLNCLMLPYF